MRRFVVLAILALAGLGCDSAQQNPFIVRVESINDGTPLFADVVAFDQTTQTFFIPTDVVPVTFTNHPYSGDVRVDPGVAWYDFNLTGYTVHWRRADGGPTSGPGWTISDFNHTDVTNAIVPFNGSATTGVLLATVGMKEREPFLSLGTNGGTIILVADVDFFGSSAIDPEATVHVSASATVTFSDFVDDNNN